MNHIQQAPLSYFNQLINLGGFETERVKFHDNIDNWHEHRPHDLVVDKEQHIISYTTYDNGVPTPIQVHLEHNLDFQGRTLEAANAIYAGLNSRAEKDQSKYKLHIKQELETMLHIIGDQPTLKAFPPLRECVLELLRLVRIQPIATDEVLSFRYKDTNPVRFGKKLKDLYDSLLLRKLIATNTSLLDLKAVFQEKPIKRQVRWTGFNWQLKLFIEEIQKSVTSQAEKWVTAAACFADKQGRPFTNEKLCQVKRPKTKLEAAELIQKIAADFVPDDQ